MPRKHFKKFLPSHDTVRSNRYVRLFGPWLHHPNLWHLNRRSVAGGVALGMLCGMIPGPVQMLCAAALALVFRVNLPVAIATTWYTNPLTIVPLYFLAYKIGVWLTGQAATTVAPPDLALTLDNIGQWIPLLATWIGAMGKPFALGLTVLGVTLAFAGYVAVRAGWRLYVSGAWLRRKRRRSA